MNNQAGSFKKLNKAEFGRIMENMEFRKKAEQHDADKPYLPLDMGLFLTGRCNLRCKHCFEWNDDGFLKNDSPGHAMREIPIEKLEECLEYTRPAKTRLYLWGGEPLVYSHFHELCELLKKDPRWTTICTNGLLIENHLDDILDISENLVLLISLDGIRECNDYIRGEGTFDRVVSNIRMMMELAQEGKFKGELSVCCVISDDMVGNLYDFCEFMETLDINTLYLSFPWYISPETAHEMDAEFENRFGDIIEIEDYSKASWQDFTFRVSEEKSDALKEELQKIAKRRWNIRVRLQPALETDEIDDFIAGGSVTAQKRSKCLAPFNRLDILQDGEVSPCKLFREFRVGNIQDESIKDIWEGKRMTEMRKRLSCGLLPACSKCVLLYLNGE